ncbi:cytochrome c oxidase subunit II [Sphingobacterium phlebotomi]|uniref:cytochrome c oxidase subunit II n=1 Tax=Sphingobacterium phlebotomi TaxID=2605433 RepID=UPI001FE3D44E|nr:cytochrome c oxidase subunit II [Sphingobacterium phlebotomi]
MKFKINNRFRAVLGCLLAVGLLFSTPSFALQQDSLAQDTAVSAVTETVEEGQADTAAAEAVADTTATAEGGEATAATTSTTSSSSSSATVADEGSQIDPQVYKNMTYYILLFLIVCTVVAVIGKVLSIYELTRKMNGKYNPFANNTFQSVLMVIFLVAFLAFVYYGYAVWGDWAWRSAVTEHGERIDTMFIVTTVIITIVLVLVHILLLTFPYIYRMRKGTKAYYYPHNDTIEKIWTIVPAVVLTVLVLFGFFTWRSITNVPEDLQKSAIQVEVLGEQFQWQIRYPGADGVIGKRNYKMTTPMNSYGIDFNDKHAWDDIQASDIVIPVNKSVRFHIISKDIIHSFYIPDFRVQINAVPGMTNYFQFTPTMTTEDMREKMNDPKYDFVMLCNKICGSGHYNMQKKVVVVTEEEYKEWLSTQNKYFTEDLQKEFAAANSEDSKELTTASLN